MSGGRLDGRAGVVVCLPDAPERHHLGDLPANVELVLLPDRRGPLPDLGRVEMLIPGDWARQAVIAELGSMARLRVIQTLSAGVDWLRGRIPAGVVVCNARGVYDGPMAEWVVGSILAMQRGLIMSRDAQLAADWRAFVPDELAGRRVLILGYGSIGTAVAERLLPFGVDVVGVARERRDGVLGLEDLDEALPAADILVDLLTDPEPLPPDHPLWRLPNALVSPHVGGDSPRSLARAYALAGVQVRRFAAGERLENEVPAHLLA